MIWCVARYVRVDWGDVWSLSQTYYNVNTDFERSSTNEATVFTIKYPEKLRPADRLRLINWQGEKDGTT